MKFLNITLIIFLLFIVPTKVIAKDTYWEVQSIDTMKYSRDLARERENDLKFEEIIKSQVRSIAETNATHVAVASPYDSEFIPFLKRWVKAVRENGLKVWYRGNFSGWEGWFGYKDISRDEHIQLVEKFILENPEIFEDGDIFTTCTECENGGPGDPRNIGDVKGYRNFLIDEYRVAGEAFKKIDKNVKANFFSMNGDVAYLVMDKKTTDALGGVVVVDHYDVNPEELLADIIRIKERSGGNVMLGEFGVRIPDIHGEMTEYQQAVWLDSALSELSKIDGIIGINYWTSFDGTTSIWNNDGTKKSSVDVISKYYLPKVIVGRVINEFGIPVKGALITANSKSQLSDKDGFFTILIVPSTKEVTVSAKRYEKKALSVPELKNLDEVVLDKTNTGMLYKIQKWFYNLFN